MYKLTDYLVCYRVSLSRDITNCIAMKTPTTPSNLNKSADSAAVVAILPNGKCIVSRQPITTTAAQLADLFTERNTMQTLYVRILRPIASNQVAPARVLREGAYGLVLRLSDGTVSRYWPAGSVEIIK